MESDIYNKDIGACEEIYKQELNNSRKTVAMISPEECCTDIGDALVYKDVCIIDLTLMKRYNMKARFVYYGKCSELIKRKFPDAVCVNAYKTGSYKKDINEYLKNNAGKIDILHMIGAYESYDYVAKIYKMYNPNGKIYLKMDFNRFWFQNVRKDEHFYNVIKQVDLITVESLNLQRILNETFDVEVDYLRNGFYKTTYNEKSNYEKKENIILTVGRLGTEQKNTELLIDSFIKADIPGWKLRLVGSIEKEIVPLVDRINSSKELRDRIEFTGAINDKKKLLEEYKKAKIFCMTSLFEACAHVYSEAGINECYIISTDVDGISDMDDFISIIHENNPDKIAAEFERLADNAELMKQKARQLYEYTKNECSWDTITDKLYMLFSEKGMV